MTELNALIVDDDPNVSAYFAYTLEVAGYKVEVAKDGRTAAALLAQSRPDLIVLDMHLPDAFGKDILSQIRRDERLRDVFVIMATGEPQSIDPQTDEMANFVLSKPIEHDQLLFLAERIRSGR